MRAGPNLYDRPIATGLFTPCRSVIAPRFNGDEGWERPHDRNEYITNRRRLSNRSQQGFGFHYVGIRYADIRIGLH